MLSSVSVKSDIVTGKEEVVVLPLCKNAKKLTGAARELDRICRSTASEYLKKNMFSADTGETLLVHLKQPKAPAHLLLLGLGDRKKLSCENVADAAGAASKALSGRRFKSASLLVGAHVPDSESPEFIEAFIKGFSLAQYKYSLKQKPPRPSSLRNLHVLSGGNRGELAKSARKAVIVADFTAKVRDLVNAPANTLTPTILANETRSICKEYGVDYRVIGKKDMSTGKMGGILSIAKGSGEEPKLLVLHYNKARKDLPLVCLVGKGVTFDSGGISLKTWEHMNEMKGDMAGAAVVIAATALAARLELPLQVVTVVPAVENMPSGSAVKPGDLVTTYSGKTVEIITTDAEGRLILADAISYVRKHYEPMVLVDYATLTGSVLIALGTRIAGVMGNSQPHIDELVAAGKRAGEPVWQLPLDDHFYKSIEGDITDLKNYSGRNGSSITAAAFLGKFSGDEPWLHVDIAGTYWSEGGTFYCSKGATGYGLDLTFRFLEKMAGL